MLLLLLRKKYLKAYWQGTIENRLFKKVFFSCIFFPGCTDSLFRCILMGYFLSAKYIKVVLKKAIQVAVIWRNYQEVKYDCYCPHTVSLPLDELRCDFHCFSRNQKKFVNFSNLSTFNPDKTILPHCF